METALDFPSLETAAAPGRAHPVFWLKASAPAITVAAPAGTMAGAILAEIVAAAGRYADTGIPEAVDLRFLKAMPEERAILAERLGRGEVHATVESLGRSEVQETALPCVWWLRHRDSEGETVGESIEIAEVPELLAGDRGDIKAGLAAVAATAAIPYPKAR